MHNTSSPAVFSSIQPPHNRRPLAFMIVLFIIDDGSLITYVWRLIQFIVTEVLSKPPLYPYIFNGFAAWMEDKGNHSHRDVQGWNNLTRQRHHWHPTQRTRREGWNSKIPFRSCSEREPVNWRHYLIKILKVGRSFAGLRWVNTVKTRRFFVQACQKVWSQPLLSHPDTEVSLWQLGKTHKVDMNRHRKSANECNYLHDKLTSKVSVWMTWTSDVAGHIVQKERDK